MIYTDLLWDCHKSGNGDGLQQCSDVVRFACATPCMLDRAQSGGSNLNCICAANAMIQKQQHTSADIT